ncbi:hypothetical protein ACFVAJ_09355 [Agromyces sp. NPDC057679]|uniref:amidohydrolase family protein n=1 Tax=Agromyces sp. NPDC057679 TaxID=3346207 RepID=UPI00366EF191
MSAAPHDLDLGPLARRARRSLNGDHAGEVGVVLPPFIDHHVHLMLVGAESLAGGDLAGVVDLGAPPEFVAHAAEREGLPRIAHAGAFVTARGGYPSGRPWAAAGSVREVEREPAPAAGPAADTHRALPGPVAAAVQEQLAFGASLIKTTLHADHGPVLDRDALDELVAEAHAASLPVVAHVEGAGMAALAIDAGVDALAHTPFTERIDDALIARAVAAGQVWISTLWINGYGAGGAEFDCAVDNLRRFRAAGGRVVYGTDLGNGEREPGTGLGVHAAELAALVEAGLGASDLIAALTDPWPLAARDDWALDGVASFVPGEPPTADESLPDWLAHARVVPDDDLELL